MQLIEATGNLHVAKPLVNHINKVQLIEALASWVKNQFEVNHINKVQLIEASDHIGQL